MAVKKVVPVEDNDGQMFQNQALDLFNLIRGQCIHGLLEVRASHQDKIHQCFFSAHLEMAQAAQGESILFSLATELCPLASEVSCR